MRVAAPIGTVLDAAYREYDREASWQVDTDFLRLTFSTGFTVVTYAFALTGRDTLTGRVNVWNDDGPATYPGGLAALTFHPCSRLAVP